MTGARIFEVAKDKGYDFVVVDVAAAHALELSKKEISEIKIETAERSPGQYSKQSTVPRRQTKRPTPKSDPIHEVKSSVPPVQDGGTYGAASMLPNAMDDFSVKQPMGQPAQSAQPAPEPKKISNPVASSGSTPLVESDPAATPLSPSEVKTATADFALTPVELPPSSALLEELSKIMRDFPEVEWAAYCIVQHNKGLATRVIALRLLGDFRDNLSEIAAKATAAGEGQMIELDVMVLTEQEHIQMARERALVFYPWMHKKTDT